MSGIVTVSLFGESFQALQVVTAREYHRLQHPAVAQVRAVLDAHHSIDDLLATSALVQSSREDGTKRFMRGLIMEAEVVAAPPQAPQSRTAPTYEISIVSQLAILEHHFDCRIFQPTEESRNRTEDIVKQILGEHGITEEQMEWNLSGTYASRNYCTQYQESSLAFIQRLLEDDGIFLACTTDDEGNELYVFSDESVARPLATGSAVPLRQSSGQVRDGTAVYALDERRHIFSGKKMRRTYLFENPAHMPEGTDEAELFSDLALYSAEEHFEDEATGSTLAQIRQQADTANARLGRMTTDSFEAILGQKFKIAVDSQTEKEFFLTSVEVDYRYNVSEEGRAGATFFTTTATVLDGHVPYRPPLTTDKPRIVGPQTAFVVAPSGTEPEGVHTDEYGRIKVQFHWDRYGSRDDKTSCWMRVAQMQTSGSMVLPRVNWEVIVEFENGDPDRPFVTGRLFNGLYMPPYALPEGKTRTSLQTASSPAGGGTNEIRFEDAAGSEEIMIQSQYNTAIVAANNRKTNVTKDETVTVGNNETLSVGANQNSQVTNGCECTVGADRSLSIGGNHNDEVNAVYGVTVGGAQTLSVGGNWMQMIGSPLDALIALGTAKAAAIASAQAEKVFNQVSGAVQGAMDAVTAPVQGMIEQAENIEGHMQRVADGEFSSMGAAITGAVALPTASDMFRNMAQVPAFARSSEEGSSTGEIAVGGAVQAAMSGQLQETGQKLKNQKLGAGQNQGGGSGGGTSTANVAGPAGDLAGFSEADSTTGPGFNQTTIASNHDETIGSLRMAAAIEPINYNIAGSVTETVGAAHIELSASDRAESVEGAVSETHPALVIVTKGGESLSANGACQLSVGGALMETVKGDTSIEGGVSASLTAAMHEFKAKTKITLKCGASSIVIDGSGVTFTTPSFNLTGSKVAAKKSVADG